MVAVCRRLIAPNVQKKVFLPGGATATSTSAVQVSDLTCDLTNMLSSYIEMQICTNSVVWCKFCVYSSYSEYNVCGYWYYSLWNDVERVPLDVLVLGMHLALLAMSTPIKLLRTNENHFKQFKIKIYFLEMNSAWSIISFNFFSLSNFHPLDHSKCCNTLFPIQRGEMSEFSLVNLNSTVSIIHWLRFPLQLCLPKFFL